MISKMQFCARACVGELPQLRMLPGEILDVVVYVVVGIESRFCQRSMDIVIV